jgi:cyclophilin family peptidyl-prolyl cis-trans isomerase/HEAT repeat protein
MLPSVWLAVCFAIGSMASVAPQSEEAQRQAILAAEDSRARTQVSLEVLLSGARSSNWRIQQLAVRALGRLERPELADAIAPLVAARRPAVRAEAANALGQAVSTTPAQAGPASQRLLARLTVEKDPAVRGAICETLGRLPYASAGDVERAEAALYDASWQGSYRWTPGSSASRIDPAPLPALTGAVKGLESLYRTRAKLWRPSPLPLIRLRVLAIYMPKAGKGAAKPGEVEVRRLATAALVAGRVPDAATFGFLSKVPDPQTRRLAAIGLTSGDQPDAEAKTIVRQLLVDPSPMVRYEALRAYGRRWQADGCAQIVNAVADVDHVALVALDLLGGGCPAAENVSAVLAAVADRIGRVDANSRAWQRPAHALVSLARIDKTQAAGRLAAFVEHPIWQVRMYAARAAVTLGDDTVLRRLAADDRDNVREAALGGLSRLVGHQADDLYMAALERPDYQLIMTAARALGGSREHARAVPAMLKALARLTAENRDTSRDPRVAILERLRDLGTVESAAVLVPYLGDFDPRIAERAAELLTAWTGQPHTPKTTVMRTGPPPSAQDLREIAGLVARVTMRGVGSFEMRFLHEDAPAAAARFVGLARAGHYNGLTIHRIVPNFIIQGGSPGANEYAGDGPYMRDEVGLKSNIRGTVGVSTRGRDTGDAQFFVNLVDNPRLDHDFTVFAEVVRGMEVVDAALEGDIIDRVEIVAASPPRR